MRSDRFEIFSTSTVRLIKDVQALKAEKMARYGLKGTNAVCLCCVYESSDGLTATELSSLGEIDKAQVSRCMTELIAKGYVYRDDRDGKRYKQKYRLTAEGARVAADIFCCFKEIEDALHRSASKEALDTFYSTLQLMCDNFAVLVEKHK